MSEVERTIRKLIKFKHGEDEFRDRQDYLASLLREADKWFRKNDESEDIFNGLDDAVAEWYDAGTKQLNLKREIQDFPDLEFDESQDEESEVEEESSEDEGEAQEAADEMGQAEAHVVEAEEPTEAEPEEQVEQPKPKVKKSKKKTAVEPDPRYDHLSGRKNRYGIYEGTKTHDAILLYEKGATVKQVTEKIGSRFYNILKKLMADGHQVTKDENGVWTVRHKDDVNGKGKDENG